MSADSTIISFEALVAIGKAQVDEGDWVGGMPWSFEVGGIPVTHESDRCYLVCPPTATLRVEPGDLLVLGPAGACVIGSQILIGGTALVKNADAALPWEEGYHQHTAFWLFAHEWAAALNPVQRDHRRHVIDEFVKRLLSEGSS